MDAIEKKTRDLLTTVKSSPGGIGYTTAKAAAAAVAAGLLVANANMIDGKGNTAHALTEKGVNYLASPEGTEVSTVGGNTTDPVTEFGDEPETSDDADTSVEVIRSNTGRMFRHAFVPLPAIANQRRSGYPTDKLQPPVANPTPDDGRGKWLFDSIFLHPDDAGPKVQNPIKTYSAVAAAANKRGKDAGQRFTSRVMDGAPWGFPGVEGVAIFRVDDKNG